MSLSIEQARKRVARGAAHLDQTLPGWQDRIDVGTLTMSGTCDCIVGQLLGDERFDLFQLFPWGEQLSGNGRPLESSLYYGVNLQANEKAKGWQRLQDAWVEAIYARRHGSAWASASDAVDAVHDSAWTPREVLLGIGAEDGNK